MCVSTIKQQIREALSDVEKPGSFCCFNVLESYPNPALHVKGLGTIGLPLSEHHAKAIFNLPTTVQSPFGKGSETLVDTSIRKSWQIDPDRFKLQNPRFRSLVQDIVRSVAKDLDVACGPEHVSAQLYKLLLYEQGAFFLPHQDSEKASGMFGTLAIVLPSKHSGGDIHLSHDGEERIFRSSERSEYDCSYAAWYADVTHEVKPVTSGYRLVLIYNLIQTNTAVRLLAPTSLCAISMLKAILPYWNDACEEGLEGIPSFLIYKLSHMYTEAALSFASLKGSDHTKFQLLKEASKGQDFTLYLAHAKKEVWGGCDEAECLAYEYYEGYSDDLESENTEHAKSTGCRTSESDDIGDCHKIIDVLEDSQKLTRVVDQSGKMVANDVDFEVEDIVQGNIFKRAPDDEDYSGYTGNEGVSTTHFYHDSVVVLIPRRGMVDFRFRTAWNDASHLLKWIESLQAEVKHASQESPREDLGRLCTLVIKHNQIVQTQERYNNYVSPYRIRFADHVLSKTAIAALQLDDVLLFEEAIAQIKEKPSPDLFEAVQTGLPRLGFDCLKRGTEMAVHVMKHIREKWSALQCLGGPSFAQSVESNDPSESVLKDWIKAQVDLSLDVAGSLDADDGTILAEIVERYGFTMLTQHVVPLINHSISETPFILAFLNRLFELRGSVRLSNASIETVFGPTLMAALQSFKVKIPTKPVWPQSRLNVTRSQTPTMGTEIRPPPTISGLQLVQVLRPCVTLSLATHAGMLFQKVYEMATIASTTVFQNTLVPYLFGLVAFLIETESTSILGHDCGQHVLQVLRLYIVRYVKREPWTAPTWARPTAFITCSCNDCIDLKAFIHDPKRKEGRFRMAQARRRHLQDYFYREEGYTTNIVREGSPHTLVITKTDALYRRDHAEWESRRAIATSNLKDIAGNGWLKNLLQGRYDEIMELRVTDPLVNESASKQLGQLPNPPAGTRKDNKKRKSDAKLAEAGQAKENKKPRQAEVVDLTSE